MNDLEKGKIQKQILELEKEADVAKNFIKEAEKAIEIIQEKIQHTRHIHTKIYKYTQSFVNFM